MKKVIFVLLLVVFLAGCNYAVPKTCDYNGKTYMNGATWVADDNCNTCGCNNGDVSCTEMACEPLVNDIPKVDKVVSNKVEFCIDGTIRHELGDAWTAQDGCSYCVCEDTGVSCSDKRCILAPGTCNVREDCDDGYDYTKDECIRGLCSNKQITKCRNNDGFCPGHCEYYDDNDCEEFTDRCTDLDCFADHARDCKLAEGTHFYISEENGIERSNKLFYKIKFSEERRNCELFIKTDTINLEVTDEFKAILRDEGWANEEIEQRINMLETERYGTTGSCFVYNTNMASLFRQWDDGHYSLTNDFINMECEGDYFRPINFYEYS